MFIALLTLAGRGCPQIELIIAAKYTNLVRGGKW